MLKLLTLALLILSAFISQAQVTKSTVQFGKNDFIVFEKTPFEEKGKKLKYLSTQKHDKYKPLIAINNETFYGTDGGLPKDVLSKATLHLNGYLYQLKVSGMYNPWIGDNFNKEFIRLIKDNSNYKIQALFSDGAGSYLAEWTIVGNAATRTVLTADEDEIVSLFYTKRK